MTVFRRIGGPYAITAWTLLLPGIIWPLSGWSNPNIGGSFLQWLVIGAIALAAAGAVLVIARVTVLPCRERAPRPWTAMGAFAVAGVVHGVVSVVLIEGWEIEPEVAPIRVVLRAALAVLWMSVIAIAVDESRRHRDVMRDLEQRLAELREVERIERERFDEIAQQLRAEAVAPVIAALERIRAALLGADVAGGAREAALRLGDVIAKQVRPLSHALLDVSPEWTPPPVLEESPSVRRRLDRIVALAGSKPSHHPWLAALIYEATATPLLAVMGVSTTIIVANAVVATTILGGVAVIANRTLGPRLRSLGTVPRLMAGLGVSLVAVAIGNAAFAIITTQVTGVVEIYPATFVTFPLLVLIINIAAGLSADRRTEEQRLVEISDQLEWTTARIAQRVRHERRILGAWLHGPTQSSLLAVAARIERADKAARSEAITAALPDLAAAIDSVQDLVAGLERPTPEGADPMRDLVRLWEGALAVEVDLQPGVGECFATDASAYATIMELLAEAFSNAIRHGSAGTARVRIELFDHPDRLRLEVADDGYLGGDIEPGMGSRMLDAVTLRWELAARGDGWTVLTAEVPCAPHVGRVVGEADRSTVAV